MWLAAALLLPFVGSARADSAAETNLSAWRRPAVAAPSPVEAARAALGRLLFHDPRLSASGRIACASCHDPGLGWSDGRAIAVGHQGAAPRRRTPTLIEIGEAPRLFWDGRSASLAEQALLPIFSATEMAMAPPDLLFRLGGIAGYRDRFNLAFPDEGLSFATVAEALAAFQRTIRAPPAPFDRWLEGDAAALAPAARRGFGLFVGKAGCAACHRGWRFTDDAFHDIGLPPTWRDGREDLGRAEVTPDDPAARYAFKTPTLRGVAARRFFMHDGSLEGLAAVIEHFASGGVARPSRSPLVRPLELEAGEKADLLAFLEALGGAEPVGLPPELPE